MKDNLITHCFILRTNKSVDGIAPTRLRYRVGGKYGEVSTSLKCKVKLLG